MKIEQMSSIEIPKKQSQAKPKTTLATITLEEVTTPKKSSQKEQNNSSPTLKTISDCKSVPKDKKPVQKTNKVSVAKNTSTKSYKADSHVQEKKKASPATKKPTDKKKKTPEPVKKANKPSNQPKRVERKIPEYKKKPKHLSEIKPTGLTQNLYNVKEIRNGIIKTKNNRYYMIIEIFPINYYQKTSKEQVNILNSFKSLFIECPTQGHFKTIVESTDVEVFIRHLMKACPNSMDKKKVKIRNELISNIQDLKISNTVNYRYYYILPYEGDDSGNRSSKFEDVYRTMMIQRRIVKDILEPHGNLIAEPDNPDFYTVETLYKILNKRSCSMESITARIMRINYDYQQYAEELGVKFNEGNIDVRDYFAPKGITIYNREILLSDGLYYTYMAIRGDGYPESLPADWMNQIRTDAMTEIDFYYKKLPYEITKKNLERKTVWNHVSMKQARNRNAQEKYLTRYNDASYILEHMKKGKDDLFDCLTVISMYDVNPENLILRRDELKKLYSTNGIKVECCYNDTEEYYKIAEPFCDFEESKIFKRCKRNFLTTTMKQNYMFTTYTMSDPEGLPLGNNLENGTIFSPNLFDTNLFRNANFTITGSPGSGKSFLEMAIGRRCYVNDIRTYYILPTKGYEYRDHVEYLNGTYAKLTPNSKDCLNIMELYPEMIINGSFKRGKEKVEKSVLVNKITFLCTWFKLLTVISKDDEYKLSSKNMQRLNALLVRMYNDYGFTEENSSIYTDNSKTKKRTMPQISSWQQYLEQDEILNVFADILNPFTKGTFKNFDGQTNIDLSKEVIAFDIEYEEVGAELQPAISYMAFQCSQSLVKSDEEHFGLILLDEGWQMLVDESVAEQVESCARLIRGYGGAIGFATQSIAEFQRNEYGPMILAMMKTKIILGTEITDIDILGSIFKLSEKEKNTIVKFKRGQGMFILNDIKIRYMLHVSEQEKYLYTTDLNVKREYKKKMEEKELAKDMKKK